MAKEIKKKNTRKQAMLTKPYYDKYWRLRLSNLAANMFKYTNLPEEINKAQMEKTIMLGSFGIFFKDEGLDKFFCLPGALTGIDVYGYPTRAKPIGKTNAIQFNELVVDKECVLIYANRTRTSAKQFINEYADKLSDLDLAIKMNTRAMKHPLMFRTSEQIKESVQTMMHQYEDDYYVVFPDKELLSDNSFEVLDFHVSATEILNLQKQKETTLNEFFNIFGISGSVEKRERMISGEMNAMMEQVAVNREIWLSTRQEAVEKINRLYGLNIDVEVPKYITEETILNDEENQEGGTDE